VIEALKSLSTSRPFAAPSVAGIGFPKPAHWRPPELSIEETSEVTEDDLWNECKPRIWRARRFVGTSFFYPVYRYRDYYSYSLLSLIRFKGKVSLNPAVRGILTSRRFQHLPRGILVDREIQRIGGPPLRRRLTDLDGRNLATQIAATMAEDIAAIESRCPGRINVVLCGGKDSMNLLLLPWSNPVVAVSGPPNFELVNEFVRRNSLSMDVHPLANDPDETLDSEKLINCCRVGLQDIRWGTHLLSIAQACRYNVVFWVGAMVDAVFTPYWKAYRDPLRRNPSIERLPHNARNALARLAILTGLSERESRMTQWTRGAHWQGVCMAIYRELTSCEVLSGYHGPAMQSLLKSLNMTRLIHHDIRPSIGNELAGRAVWYPDTNPGPARYQHRVGSHSLDDWLDLCSSLQIDVV
jgi:hypothetical protein